jgi:long-chain fatty acid transport protein
VTSKRLLFAALASTAPASAAGLYYADRGVRPLGRAGAFVAGADDLGAIVYNPAGLFDAGGQFLFDASWVHFTSDYTRIANVQQIDPNSGAVVGTSQHTFSPVQGTTPVLPIPTMAVSFRVHKDVVIAAGVWAPYAALTTYPSTVAAPGGGMVAAPQRYSLVTLDGSLLAFAGAGVAWRPIKQLRVGATVGMLTGVFNTQATFAGCVPERFLCAPEEPSWDVNSKLSVGPIFAPTGQIGVTFLPVEKWRIGASFQLPVWVRSGATLQTRLPSTPVFEQATQVGNHGNVAFDLPWILRAGVEMRAVDNLRLELSMGYEAWSMHDAITLTPDHIALTNVAGFPQSYYIPPVTLPRHFQDAGSVHLGGEYHLAAGGLEWDIRGGVSFESSAVPTNYLSVLTIDQNKVTTAIGGSLYWRNLRLDLTYAHVFGFDTNVNPNSAQLSLISPVQANPPKTPDIINGGNYSARADVIGLGLAYTFDPQLPDETPPPPPPPPAKKKKKKKARDDDANKDDTGK